MGATHYYAPGYEPAAPAQNMAEQWNDATQTYTSWDTSGNVTLTRPYTAAEVAAYEAQQAQAVLSANQTAITNAANNALTVNLTFLTATPTFPLTTAEQQALVAQVAALTRQVNGLIRLVLQNFTSTTGT